jgi:hypothetical protein
MRWSGTDHGGDTDRRRGRTTSDVLKAAGLALSPVVGTVLACVIIGTARLLWGIGRRTLKAIWTFSGNVLTDILHLVKRPSGQECRPPWTLSISSRRSLKILVLSESYLFY